MCIFDFASRSILSCIFFACKYHHLIEGLQFFKLLQDNIDILILPMMCKLTTDINPFRVKSQHTILIYLANLVPYLKLM